MNTMESKDYYLANTPKRNFSSTWFILTFKGSLNSPSFTRIKVQHLLIQIPQQTDLMWKKNPPVYHKHLAKTDK